jgi:hypothetical protein
VLLPGEGAVLLPCEPDQFTNFIAGLLGQPQTLERTILMVYDLNRDGIINIHHIISQRILQQNDGVIVNITIKILLSDKSSVTFNSLDQFSSYVDVNGLMSVGVELKWTCLIKFRGKNIPERQAIHVGFSTDIKKEYSESVLSYMFKIGGYNSPISIRIEHTDRTWGVDIDNLLRGHLNSIKVQSGDLYNFMCKYRAIILAAIFLLVSVVIIYHVDRWNISVKNAAWGEQLRVWSSIASNSMELLLSKLDYYIEKDRRSSSDGFSFLYTMMTVLFSGFFWIISVAYVDATLVRRSHIIITSVDSKSYSLRIKRIEKNFAIYLMACVSAIILSIVANVITNRMFG